MWVGPPFRCVRRSSAPSRARWRLPAEVGERRFGSRTLRSAMSKTETGLFPALLRYWRGRRGLSQLDLAVAADVSSRHVSFLETGRAQPGRDMVLRLGATLEVPLRDQNELL